MKNNDLLFKSILTGFLLIPFALPLFSQKYQGQSVSMIGIGVNTSTKTYEGIESGLSIVGKADFSKSPVIAVGYDYGISDRLSLGLVYTRQEFIPKYTGYKGKDALGNEAVFVDEFKDKITCQSFGVRPMFHVGENEDLDVSFGARVSYLMWNYTSLKRDDVNKTDLYKKLGSPFRVQGLLRVSYFFTENIGAGLELAVGQTYFALLGLNLRFGGM